MKKFVKIIIIILILIILILGINTVRNVCIINKLKNSYNQYFSDMISYKIFTKEYVKYTVEGIDETKKSQNTKEIYYKDSKYLIKNKIGNYEPDIELVDKVESEKKYDDFMDYLESLTVDGLKTSHFNNPIIELYVFSFIKEDSQNYIIYPFSRDTFYFNKENGIVSKVVQKDGSLFQEYSVEKNTVTDEDMEYTEIN